MIKFRVHVDDKMNVYNSYFDSKIAYFDLLYKNYNTNNVSLTFFEDKLNLNKHNFKKSNNKYINLKKKFILAKKKYYQLLKLAKNVCGKILDKVLGDLNALAYYLLKLGKFILKSIYSLGKKICRGIKNLVNKISNFIKTKRNNGFVYN